LETSTKVGTTIAFIVLVFIIFIVCIGVTRIGPGHVGIKVNMAGDQRGVSDFPQTTGWVFYNRFSTQIFEYPTYMQMARWTSNKDEGSPLNEEVTFNSKDGAKISGDISLAFTLNPAKVPHFYVRFRSDDLTVFTHGYLRSLARNEFNKYGPHYTAEEIYATKTEALINDVHKALNDMLDSVGVQIDQFGFIGAPRPPENIVNAINQKIQATQDAQRAQNEVATVEAQARKAIAKAEGESKSNQIMSSSITSNLLEWRRLQLQQMQIEKWKGDMPQVISSGQGMLMNLDVMKK
jgi:regulator of protease activity HflC (stomatin/prohibitin superfamily)